MLNSKLKFFLNSFLAVSVVVLLSAVALRLNQPKQKPPIGNPNGNTVPLEITIYCEAGYCQPKQIMAGAGALVRTCYRDLKSCESNWKTLQDDKNKVSFQYPADFGANVWRAFVWPPKLTVVAAGEDPIATGCPEILTDSSPDKKPSGTDIKLGGHDFKLYASNGAGAGSLYSTYCYVTPKDQSNVALEFVIQSHTGCYQGGCGAYCGTQYEQECRNFDLQRDVAVPINTIVSTLKFN